MIGEIRAVHAPYPVALTGVAAAQYDQHVSLRSHMVLALPILAATTLLVLFMMTGSVVLAIKSLAMNLLTLSGAFGILVLVFQDGHGQSLLSFNASPADDPLPSPPAPPGALSSITPSGKPTWESDYEQKHLADYQLPGGRTLPPVGGWAPGQPLP